MTEVRVSRKVKPIVQPTSTTCWLASFQMLYQWKGKGKHEVFKKLDDTETYGEPAAPGWPPPRYANPHQMILDGIGRKDLLPAAKTLKLKWGAGGHLRIETLANGLKKFGPVWAAGNWNQAFHVILLVGAVVSKKMPMVIYINPWTQYGGSQKLTKPLKWFNEGRGHWKNVNGSLIHW